MNKEQHLKPEMRRLKSLEWWWLLNGFFQVKSINVLSFANSLKLLQKFVVLKIEPLRPVTWLTCKNIVGAQQRMNPPVTQIIVFWNPVPSRLLLRPIWIIDCRISFTLETSPIYDNMTTVIGMPKYKIKTSDQ